MKTAIDTLNTSRVLRAIWLNKQMSRTEIAKLLKLDKSTITKIVSNLDESGIVVPAEEGEASPRGGRRPIYLTIRKEYGCVLGLEIRSDSYFATLLDLGGEVLSSHTERARFSGKDFVADFFEILENERPNIDATRLPLLGIGLGISSIVNPREGTIDPTFLLRIAEPIHFYKQVAPRLKVPVQIENDANCACWGELAGHSLDESRDFLFVLGELRNELRGASGIRPSFYTLAIGIGIVIGGRVRHGSDYATGEFRSILWDSSSTTQFSVGDREIGRIEKDPKIRARVFQELAAHVGFLANVLDLNDVIIGGAIEKYNEELIPLFERAIERNWLYANQTKCRVRGSSFGPFAVSYGAAGMFLEQIFSLPDLTNGIDLKANEGVVMLQKIGRTRTRAKGSLRG